MREIGQLLLGIVACAIACVITGLVAHSRGYQAGQADAEAAANRTAVTALTDGIQQYRDAAAEHTRLVEASQHASQLIRAATDAAAQYNRSTTNELRSILAETAAERADCRFDDRVMQHLGAARDRAAAQAAGAAPSGADAGVRTAPASTNGGR